MNNTKLLLLDFDVTLTKFHTTGALCFSNTNFDAYLNPNTLFQNELCLSENSNSDPLFLIDTLQSLVDKGVCIGIITMADTQHGELRGKQLNSQELKNSYHVLAGRDLVMKWLCNIVLRACNFDEKLASERIKRLFESKRLCIVAQFRQNSKREHLVEVFRIFESLSTLNPHCVKPEEIVYADDSAELILDMQNALPGIHTILIVGGLTETKWQNILKF